MKIIGNTSDPALITKLEEIHATACKKLADAGLLYTNVMDLTVKLNDKMRSRAGCAHCTKNLIELNFRLLRDKLGEFECTYLHELAHLASYYKYGSAGLGHGSLWASVMNVLGLPAERCHSMDTSALVHRRIKKHAYVCVNMDCSREEPYLLTTRKHNKVRGGYLSIACRQCSGSLAYDKSKGEK